jgi:hypothetical protein
MVTKINKILMTAYSLFLTLLMLYVISLYKSEIVNIVSIIIAILVNIYVGYRTFRKVKV